MKEETRWYMKLLYALIIIVFSPLLLLFIIIGLIYSLFEWIKTPYYKKQYHASPYFKNFAFPYNRYTLYMPSYITYNTAREKGLDLELIHDEEDNPDYIIFKERLYLFPDFDQISYDQDKWIVDYDGDWDITLEEDIKKKKSTIKGVHVNLPYYLLLPNEMIGPDNPIDLLPSYIKLVDDYTSILQ